METELVYLNDSYQKECTSKIISLIDPKKVILNKTIFYPQGGGQPSDTGTITCWKLEYKVISVKKINGQIIHEMDKEGLLENDEVICKINWEKRYKHMRMHSSSHILANIINKETNGLITGNQLGENESRMDFNAGYISPDFAKTIQTKTNEAISKDYKISSKYMPREEVLKDPTMFKLKDVLPKEIPIFRILSIGDFDIQADGGTHVNSTKEIGSIEIFDLKNKGAENKRIYWKLT